MRHPRLARLAAGFLLLAAMHLVLTAGTLALRLPVGRRAVGGGWTADDPSVVAALLAPPLVGLLAAEAFRLAAVGRVRLAGGGWRVAGVRAGAVAGMALGGLMAAAEAAEWAGLGGPQSLGLAARWEAAGKGARVVGLRSRLGGRTLWITDRRDELGGAVAAVVVGEGQALLHATQLPAVLVCLCGTALALGRTADEED